MSVSLSVSTVRMSVNLVKNLSVRFVCVCVRESCDFVRERVLAHGHRVRESFVRFVSHVVREVLSRKTHFSRLLPPLKT
jgi:hypothetical protein